jgi:hypothetical protein
MFHFIISPFLKKNVTIISVPNFTFWLKKFDETWDISTLHVLIPYNL